MLGACTVNHSDQDEATRIAAAFIARRESFRAVVYFDVARNATVGYGHKLLPGEKFAKPLTSDEALSLLMQDIGKHRGAVDSLLHVDRLTPSQRAALYSFAFNCGTGAIRTSGIGAAVEAGELKRVPAILKRWVMATDRVTHKKQVVAGLVARRAAEIELWNFKE